MLQLLLRYDSLAAYETLGEVWVVHGLIFLQFLCTGVNMSDSALKDLNLAQSAELEKTKDSSAKSCITKPVLNGNKCNNTEENAPPVLPDAVTNGCEAGNADVEYIDSESLTELEDAGATLSVCHQMFIFMIFFVLGIFLIGPALTFDHFLLLDRL